MSDPNVRPGRVATVAICVAMATLLSSLSLIVAAIFTQAILGTHGGVWQAVMLVAITTVLSAFCAWYITRSVRRG